MRLLSSNHLYSHGSSPLSTVITAASLLALLSPIQCCLDILPLKSSLKVEEYQTNILQSSDGTFSCGFYNIFSNAFTFSIWYSNGKTIVWTANRGRPVHSKRSAITLQKDGTMVLKDYDGATVWFSDGVFTNVRYAQLLNNGNLVLKNSNGEIVWQSFDSPTDTLLPTQHITASTKLVSTNSLHAPGRHAFSFSNQSILSLIYDGPKVMDINWPDPNVEVYQNNRSRSDSPRLGFLDDFGRFYSVDISDQILFVASDEGLGIKRRLTLDPDGNLRVYSLNSSNGMWSISWIAMLQPCRIDGLCGPYGICHYSPTPMCSCPPGYVLSNPRNWSDGCRAIVDITCNGAQPVEFFTLQNTDFLGFDQQHIDGLSLQACRNICMNDCTCRGFQYREGSGSCYPKSFLFNGRTFPTPSRTMYLKLPKSVNTSNIPLPQSNVLVSTPQGPSCDLVNTPTVVIPFPELHKTFERVPDWIYYFYGFLGAFFLIEVFFVVFAWFFILRRELRSAEHSTVKEGLKVMANYFRRYSFKELGTITQNFRDELGRGGSGIVYKGTLDDGRMVAVKRLENVRRGEEEFQAELCVVGRINHMNLVRIWGFCSESTHRMLVSEYIENGSLANALFKNNILLQWGQRFSIALGIAKGLAYLHHECLEWVIHCDVKPENILLDQNLEPKIADFGLAKLLSRGGLNQKVSRVRGTIGYIAPEWVSGLPITAKADVYSYGAVLLELVSGMQISDLSPVKDDMVPMVLRNLVFTLCEKLDRKELSWISEFADFRLRGQFNYIQARALIKLAVSCLEEDTRRRPTMESIVEILVSVHEANSATKKMV